MSAPVSGSLAQGTASPASNSTTSLTQPQADELLDEDNQSDTYSETDSEPDPQSVDAENYRYGSHTFNFELLDTHITTATAPYLDTTPAPTRSAHNATHSSLFTSLRAAAAADPSLPTALFTPPRTFVRVYFQPLPVRQHYCCPCDLSEGLTAGSVDIRAPEGSAEGITADLFLEKVGAALYGNEEGSLVGREDDRPVIEKFDYMCTGAEAGERALMGHIWAMTRGFGAAKAGEEKVEARATAQGKEVEREER